jgi:hypothetical protein
VIKDEVNNIARDILAAVPDERLQEKIKAAATRNGIESGGPTRDEMLVRLMRINGISDAAEADAEYRKWLADAVALGNSDNSVENSENYQEL